MIVSGDLSAKIVKTLNPRWRSCCLYSTLHTLTVASKSTSYTIFSRAQNQNLTYLIHTTNLSSTFNFHRLLRPSLFPFLTMRLPTTLLPIFLASFAASKSFAFFGSDQKVLNEELSVPGANPLEFCQSNDNYSLDITYVDLTPNPPSPLAFLF